MPEIQEVKKTNLKPIQEFYKSKKHGLASSESMEEESNGKDTMINLSSSENQTDSEAVAVIEAAEKIPLDLDSYNFDAFISKMRHDSCKPILENIKRFIKVFLDKLPQSNIEDLIEAYKSFYSVIKVKCMQTAAWQSEDVSPLMRANALEGLESLIMNQLHDRVLACEVSERDMDDFMERKMVLYGGWIQLHHLDVPEIMAESLKETENYWISSAVTEFQKMSLYRTPRDKLVCALNGCKIINSLIHGKMPADDPASMSADDFLSVLIYTIIRANPPQIHSNINYITRFRAPERISGESAYFFTHLMAAVEFIEKMDRESLTITEEAYENFMEAAVNHLNNHQQHRSSEEDYEADSLTEKIDEKLDFAEAKAEELFLKAKEAFKATSERANQAFFSFKESKIAKKSVEKLNQFFKEMAEATTTTKTQTQTTTTSEFRAEESTFEEELVRALANSSADQDLVIDRSAAEYTEADESSESENKHETEIITEIDGEKKSKDDDLNDDKTGGGAVIDN